jgi:hypothetical protein
MTITQNGNPQGAKPFTAKLQVFQQGDIGSVEWRIVGEGFTEAEAKGNLHMLLTAALAELGEELQKLEPKETK